MEHRYNGKSGGTNHHHNIGFQKTEDKNHAIAQRFIDLCICSPAVSTNLKEMEFIWFFLCLTGKQPHNNTLRYRTKTYKIKRIKRLIYILLLWFAFCNNVEFEIYYIICMVRTFPKHKIQDYDWERERERNISFFEFEFIIWWHLMDKHERFTVILVEFWQFSSISHFI